MYYTNGRCHLRAAISHLYRQTITEDISSILPTSKLVQENVMPQTQVINHIKQLNGSQNENIAHQVRNTFHILFIKDGGIFLFLEEGVIFLTSLGGG